MAKWVSFPPHPYHSFQLTDFLCPHYFMEVKPYFTFLFEHDDHHRLKSIVLVSCSACPLRSWKRGIACHVSSTHHSIWHSVVTIGRNSLRCHPLRARPFRSTFSVGTLAFEGIFKLPWWFMYNDDNRSFIAYSATKINQNRYRG